MRTTLTAAAVATVGLIGSVAVAPADAKPTRIDQAPIRELTRPTDELDSPTALAHDKAGRLYVADSGRDAIVVFAADRDNGAPIRTITGPATTIESPSGIAVRDGLVYVSTRQPGGVVAFDLEADGDVAPQRAITGPSTGLRRPDGVYVDADGRVYVTHVRDGREAVSVFGPSADGDAKPKRTITGRATGLDAASSVVADRQGRAYVSNFEDDSVTVYGARADGNAAPVRTIAGKRTELDRPYGIDLDAAGNIYVANWGRSVTVHGRRADGNAAPKVVLEGGRTLLTQVDDVTVDGDNRVSVVIYEGGRVSTYRPLVVVRPGRVEELAMSGTPTAIVRELTWDRPASTGGQIRGYRVVVRDGDTVIWSKDVRKTREKLRFFADQLGRGRHTATVRALNRAGQGPPSRVAFVVRPA